jgi:hypothetical protein
VDSELDERPFVDQQRQPLARGQLVGRVLGYNLLGPSALLDLLTASLEVRR